MSRIYYISDTHFGHKNILAYDNRPFESPEQMEERIVKNWNDSVSDDDTIYILGDVAFGTHEYLDKVLSQLKGTKILIIGNHDAISQQNMQKHFVESHHYAEIKDGNKSVVLCHYPIPSFKNHFQGWIHLYGHVHSSFEYNMTEHHRYQMESLYLRRCEMINVGCMMPWMKYAPRTLDEIIAGYRKYTEKHK